MGDRDNAASSIPHHMREEEAQDVPADIQQVLDVAGAEFAKRSLKVHKFWSSQPVRQYNDPYIEMLKGPIKPNLEAEQQPCDINAKYQWVTLNLNSDEMLKVQNLLNDNYAVEDDIKFPNFHSKELLEWCLCPPETFNSWYVGVQAKESKALVAFIAGTPANLWLDGALKKVAVIKFLCLHKKLRLNRIAPVLMKEMKRRVVSEGFFQAAYTTSAHLPTPIASCQYWLRLLNPMKLLKIGFSTPGGKKLTKAQAANVPELPHATQTPGFQQMLEDDVPAVTKLLSRRLHVYHIEPEFTEDEVKHWFLPKESVVNSFVVKDQKTSEVTDFCSFYMMTSMIPGNKQYPTLKAGYLFYFVAAPEPLKDKLMLDCLVVAKQNGCDVFYALNVMENEKYIKPLKFKRIEGSLHYYLYNYRLNKLLKPSGIGLVLV